MTERAIARLALIRAGVVVAVARCAVVEAEIMLGRGDCDGWIALADGEHCEEGWAVVNGRAERPIATPEEIEP